VNDKHRHPNPNNGSGQEQQRKISGKVHVDGEVEVDFAKSLVEKYESAQETEGTRQERKYRLDKITLVAAIIYTSLAGIQSCESIKGVSIAKDSLESVQRAFVFPTGMSDIVFAPDGKTPIGVKFTIRWENSGTTPTKEVTVHSNMQWWKPKMPDDFSFTDRWDPGIPHKDRQLYLAPKGYVDTNIRIISASDLFDIANGKIQYFLFGWARYHDTFSNTKQHITRYCYQIIANPQGGDDQSHVFFHTMLLTCDRNNCYDDQCQVQ
jgi:hypothetical protein